VFRVILQNGHNEHEPIEICKPQYGVDVEISACTTRGLVNVAEDSARQGRTSLVAVSIHELHSGLCCASPKNVPIDESRGFL
jgi:hypothetical protein